MILKTPLYLACTITKNTHVHTTKHTTHSTEVEALLCSHSGATTEQQQQQQLQEQPQHHHQQQQQQLQIALAPSHPQESHVTATHAAENGQISRHSHHHVDSISARPDETDNARMRSECMAAAQSVSAVHGDVQNQVEAPAEGDTTSTHARQEQTVTPEMRSEPWNDTHDTDEKSVSALGNTQEQHVATVEHATGKESATERSTAGIRFADSTEPTAEKSHAVHAHQDAAATGPAPAPRVDFDSDSSPVSPRRRKPPPILRKDTAEASSLRGAF
jgi:hypothetical protein